MSDLSRPRLRDAEALSQLLMLRTLQVSYTTKGAALTFFTESLFKRLSFC